MPSAPETIRLLHVEDDPEFADIAATFLERADNRFEITSATAVTDGLEYLSEHRIDCIVSDYEMPDMNGIDFLEAVRLDHPKLPFILYTGKGSEEIASEAITAGVTDYLQKGQGTDQYTVLANRITNAVVQFRTARRAANLTRVNSMVREVNDALVRATHRDEIDEAVCEIISAADPYRLVWIGQYDSDADRVYPRASAGIDSGYLDETELPESDQLADSGPIGTALRTGSVRAIQDITANQRTDSWQSTAAEHGYRSFAAVPLIHESTRYGILTVYADREDAFDEQEQALLAELGDSIAHGYYRIDVQHQQAELYRSLFEKAPIMFAFTEEQNGVPIISDCNTELARKLGYTADELIGTPIQEIYDEESRESLKDKTTFRELQSGEFIDKRRTLVTKTGNRIPTILRASPRQDHTGRLVGTRAMYLDISEELEMHALEATKERMEFALDATDSLIFEIELDTRTETRHGPFDRLFGVSSADLETSEQFYERAIHPDDRASLVDFFASLEEGQEAQTIEIRTHPDNGPVRWIRTSAFIRSSGDDDGNRVIGLDTDVTREKRREIRLEALNEMAGKLVTATSRQEIADIGVEAARDIIGFEATGLHLQETETKLVPIAYTEALADIVGEPPVLAEGESIAWRVFETGEAMVLDDIRDDTDRYNTETPMASELFLPIGDYGILIAGSDDENAYDEQDRVLGEILANNIAAAIEQVDRKAELRSREKTLKQQNERLDEFTSVVSHDLRNPLNIATGRVQLAQEACDSDHLDAAAAAHERMHTLIDDLLTLAREGAEVSDRVPVELHDFVWSCWENVATYDATLLANIDRTIQADPTRLGQLFENLFRNAVEHGGSDVTVEIGPVEGGFFVEDNGPGIAPQNREHVFEGGYSTSEDGTGFGLTIVEQVVEAHGWALELTSGTDGGTRFEITGMQHAQ